MDAVSADDLVAMAEAGRASMRRQQPDAWREVEFRYAEMLEALAWYVEHGGIDSAFRLASALVPFWLSTKRIADGDRWFDRLLAAPVGSEARRTRALYDHGYLVFWPGRYELATAQFQEALTRATALADDGLQALALAGLARVALNTDVDEAIRLLHQALAVTAGRDDADEGRSSVLHVLGVALQMSGDLNGARQVMSQRLASAAQRGDTFVAWVESANLSMVERQLGNLDRAEELACQALKIDVGRRDEMSIAWTVNGLAAVTAAKGALDRAATLHAIAATMLERAGGEWPPDERKQYDETLAALARGLTQDELQLAQARGAAMTPDEAIAYALAQ
jgi:tetratricopeptide (TPR) repeat protein